MLALERRLVTVKSEESASISITRQSFAGWRQFLLFVLIACISFCLALSADGQSAPAKTAQPKTPANPLASIIKGKQVVPSAPQELPATLPEPAPPANIPLPDVAARSLELSQLLRDTSNNLPSPDQLQAMQKSLLDLGPEIENKQKEVAALLAGTPNSLDLGEQDSYWRDMQSDIDRSEQQLLAWANNAQSAIQNLDQQEPNWVATLEENRGNDELEPVLAVITTNLTEIRKLRAQAKAALQLVVNMQIKAGNYDQSTADVLNQLAQARVQIKGHILDRDSLPLWKVDLRRRVGEDFSLSSSVNSRWIAITTFVRDNVPSFIFLFSLALVSIVGARHLYVLTRNKIPEDDLEADAQRVLKHWFALGLLPPLVIGYALAPSAPITVIGLVVLISFIPILLILPPLLEARFRLLLYFLAGMYAFNVVVAWLTVSPSAKREFGFITNFLLFLVFAYLVRPTRRLGITLTRTRKVLLFGVRLAIVALGVSLLANLFGYMKLSHFLGLACTYSTFVAIGAFTTVKALSLLLEVALRSPVAERLAMVRQHRDPIAIWIPRVLKWAGVFIWLTATLDLLSMDDTVTKAVAAISDFHIAGSAAAVTLGGVLGFFAILLIGYAIANAIRFILREEILKRFHLSRGLPELIASMMYYLVLLLVFLAAISAGGIELNKFTVLTGAIGVGFGFGLQNIINNFVSGLILQFERPIHINDVLEIDGATGKVTRIGVRSSTILTFQGAEVIIPNANFISSKVINWTLTESQRRRELPVGVAYGSDPNLVLKLLREAAASHELVLIKPEPLVYFKGFGDSTLDFELHFWVMQENNGMQITSEVALKAMRLLNDAGIEIPFPQRDLHVRSIDPTAAGLLPANDAEKPAAVAKNQAKPLQPEVVEALRPIGD
jgi:potassium efflux system protein